MPYIYEQIQELVSNSRSLAPLLPTGGAEVLLSSLGGMRNRYQWSTMTDSEWDDLFALIENIERALMESAYISAVLAFAGDLPENCLLCDGQIVAESDYPELTTKAPALQIGGGNLQMPDLRDKFVRGGTVANIGNTGGADTVALGVTQLPPHSHTEITALPAVVSIAPGIPGPGAIPGVGVTGITGGGLSHNNVPEYYVLAYGIIAR